MGQPKSPAAHPLTATASGPAEDRNQTKSYILPEPSHPTTRQASALSQQLVAEHKSARNYEKVDHLLITTTESSTPSAHQNYVGIPSLHIREPSIADVDHSSDSTTQKRERKVPALTPPIVIPARPLKSSLSTVSMNSSYSKSPGSAISSPALAAMSDITPLPSPVFSDDPGAWRRDRARRHGSVGSLRSLIEDTAAQDFSQEVPSSSASRSSSLTKKRKPYPVLAPSSIDTKTGRMHDKSHARVKSLGESVTEPIHNVRPRTTTVSTVANPVSHNPLQVAVDHKLHRESHLAGERGFVHAHQSPKPHSHHTSLPPITTAALPTPPPSNRSITDSDGDELMREDDTSTMDTPITTMTVRDRTTKRTTQYKQIRPLGEGTFSKVVLATKQQLPPQFQLDETSESRLDPKKLAAVKIVEHGPAGGADEDRMKISLQREVEIMRTLSHPSLIDLRGYSDNSDESLLVLGYCPGGDLFELATENKEALKNTKLVQRIFAELVGALQHLHGKNIVHRDVKLENVLVNLRREALATIHDPTTFEKSIVTLTDLGLSRTIDPEEPLLTTRCGSEAYAAPEIILSQPYDGRQTDAWALGCVLFTLMELRLPFEPPPVRPGYRVRSRGVQTHRIARNEWVWAEFGDDYGEWDATRGAGWESAREVVEGLLKKVNKGRLTLDEVAELPWVKAGINVSGGIKRGYEDDETDTLLTLSKMT